MYIDGDDGMYDIWYDGLELDNGHSTVRLALQKPLSDHEDLAQLKLENQVEILTDLAGLQPNLLDAYCADEVEIRVIH